MADSTSRAGNIKLILELVVADNEKMLKTYKQIN